ncbi:DNA polymerase III subunit delta [Buchnera aphidicola]|uniref:DNA polymerase III subunit delta n=1 Tax=Buchnera aphidicola TaxID=9 RepID=UPI0034640FEA
MNIIYPEELKKKLTQKLHCLYILLGEDLFLLNKNEKLILNFAKKKNFLEKSIINIEKNADWNKIINFYKLKNIFFKKNILVINFIIKKIDKSLTNHINKILSIKNTDILVIVKFYALSNAIKKSKIIKTFDQENNIISCFTPYEWAFKNWLKYEIKERNLKIKQDSLLLIYKYYQGNTLFAHQILNIISITWPCENIETEKVKQIIDNFSIFSPIHWINAIFSQNTKKAIYILDSFFQKKYNPIFLVRSLQNDLLILINMKREKKIDINAFLRKNNVWLNRSKFFIHALNVINFNHFLKIIRILLKIEKKIKKEYDNSVWIELKTLTLLLSFTST